MTNLLKSYLRCNTCLDSSKTGLKIREEVLRADEEPFQGKRVKSMVSDEASENSMSNVAFLTERPDHLGTFVLDDLVKFGGEVATEHMRAIDTLKENVVSFYHRDKDLLRPKHEAEEAAKKAAADNYLRLSNELRIIEDHVQAAYKLWNAALHVSPSKSKSPKKQKKAGCSEDPWRKAARMYAEGPSSPPIGLITANLDAVKASFAYALTPKFAMSVAHKEICAIKARASGTDLPMTREFGETMSIGSSFVRALGFDEAEYS